MRFSRGPGMGLLALLTLLTLTHAADSGLPNLSTLTQPNGAASSSAASSKASATASSAAASSETDKPTGASFLSLTGLPTIAGAGIPTMVVPDTSAAPFMQKSNLPDGTVFICVGAALGFFGLSILAWRGLVAWSLHRSVKRAAAAQNLSDLKSGMGGYGGPRKNFYTAVSANSTLSLDRLSAAPPGHARPGKPFARQGESGTPPRTQSSLFFSPTAGGATGLRDSMVNRSSTYLPAGYYASGSAAPASGSPMTTLGGHGYTHSHGTPSILSLGPTSQGYSRARSAGVSPPGSPSLPPSRGYDRAPPSRSGESMYDPRKSVYTMHTNASNLSLNVPGGTTVPGGRAPSAYLEDLFESHGTAGGGANGGRERLGSR